MAKDGLSQPLDPFGFTVESSGYSAKPKLDRRNRAETALVNSSHSKYEILEFRGLTGIYIDR